MQQVYMYFRGSGKADEMKRDAARGAMRAAIWTHDPSWSYWLWCVTFTFFSSLTFLFCFVFTAAKFKKKKNRLCICVYSIWVQISNRKLPNFLIRWPFISKPRRLILWAWPFKNYEVTVYIVSPPNLKLMSMGVWWFDLRDNNAKDFWWIHRDL